MLSLLVFLAPAWTHAEQNPQRNSNSAMGVFTSDIVQTEPAAERVFSIPAQPLATALNVFGRQAGLQISAASEVTDGLNAPAVTGVFTSEAALDRLLKGSGIQWRTLGSHTIVLEKSSSGVALNLPPISIEGERPSDKAPVSEMQSDAAHVNGMVATHSASATKTATPLVEIPQSVSVVTSDEMQTRKVQTLSEALRYSPGVVLEAYGVDPRGYDYLHMRGFDAQQKGNFRDGLRMIGSYFAVFATETFGMERISVLRGPSGAMYGQGDAAGIVDRATKQPAADQVQQFELQAGSFDHYQAALDVGDALDDQEHYLYRFTGLVRDSATEFDYNNGQQQKNDRIFVAPALSWQPDDDTRLTLLADYLEDERAPNFGTFGGTDRERTEVVTGEPDFDRFHHRQYSIGYLFSHRLSDQWTFRQNTRFTDINLLEYQSVVPVSLQADGRTLNRNIWSSPDHLSQFVIDNQIETHVAREGMDHTVLMGMDLDRTLDTFTYYSAPAPTLDINNPVYAGTIDLPAPYQSTRQVLQQDGVYLQDQLKFEKHWLFTLGGRYSRVKLATKDRLNEITERNIDTAFTKRAGITYLFDSGVAPYASYAEGFVPTTGVDSDGHGFDPERSRLMEIGVKYQPPGFNALFTFAAFDLTKRNVKTINPTNTIIVQSGEIRSRGIELEAKAALNERWEILAAYSYNDVEVTRSIGEDLHKVPIQTPRHIASAWLSCALLQTRHASIDAGFGLRYMGETYDDAANTSKTDSFTVADALLRYRFGDDYTLALNVNNVFDREYVTTCADAVCYWGPGRRVIGSFAYRW